MGVWSIVFLIDLQSMYMYMFNAFIVILVMTRKTASEGRGTMHNLEHHYSAFYYYLILLSKTENKI